MDPASAILAFVTASVQVIKLVKDTLDDIRNAPKELQVLRERVDDIEMSLEELQRQRIEGLFQSEEDIVRLERIGGRVNACLEEIRMFMAKVQTIGKRGSAVVDRWKWLMKGDTLKDLSRQLDRLDSTLNAVMNLVNS